MRHLRSVLFLVVLCFPSLTVAQTIFDVSGTIALANGDTLGGLSGSFYLDGYGQTASWNIVVPGFVGPGGAVAGFTFNPGNSSSFEIGPDLEASIYSIYFRTGQSGSANEVELELDVPCSFDQKTPCLNGVNDFVAPSRYWPPGNGPAFQVSGEITPGGTIAATPEPSSLVLLGSGLAALFGFGRRHLNRPHN